MGMIDEPLSLSHILFLPEFWHCLSVVLLSKFYQSAIDAIYRNLKTNHKFIQILQIQLYPITTMPIRKTKTKGTRHQKIAPRPSQSAPPAPPSFATPQSHPPRPPPSAPPAPITLPTSQPYSPLPPQLANKMVSLIHLSSQIESLSQALSYGLFATPSDQHSATTRMTTLRTKYTAFRSHVDSELTSLGYLPSHTNTPLPPSSSSSSSRSAWPSASVKLCIPASPK